ncbi:hypothetical protein FRB95_011357 [Tulasnella sp. JGI-2019a]|nr:hypothetical protein FRB95_011357 [Tulasnella sp. JGI-2019a]
MVRKCRDRCRSPTIIRIQGVAPSTPTPLARAMEIAAILDSALKLPVVTDLLNTAKPVGIAPSFTVTVSNVVESTSRSWFRDVPKPRNRGRVAIDLQPSTFKHLFVAGNTIDILIRSLGFHSPTSAVQFSCLFTKPVRRSVIP